MTVHATVYSADGTERFDDVQAAIDAPGETWVHVADPAVGASAFDAVLPTPDPTEGESFTPGRRRSATNGADTVGSDAGDTAGSDAGDTVGSDASDRAGPDETLDTGGDRAATRPSNGADGETAGDGVDAAAGAAAAIRSTLDASALDGELARVAAAFGIHPLAVEDVLREDSRPKTETYDEHTFLLVKTARLRSGDVSFDRELRVATVGVFVGTDWLVTVAPPDVPVVDEERNRWLRDERRIARRGTDFVAYRLVDGIVEGYFALLDDVETEIETIEERVLAESDPELLADLNAVRRDLLSFRRIAWPAREAIGVLARGDSPHVRASNEKYFRDAADHLVQVVDLIETYRDLTAGSRDIYLNTVSQSTNEVMKTLTVVATIFIPLTFVAGVYGMNFDATPFAMPELGWTFAYPAAMLGMLGVALVMLRQFREHGWL